MTLIEQAKQELLTDIMKTLAIPSPKIKNLSDDILSLCNKINESVLNGEVVEDTEIPLDAVIQNNIFNLISNDSLYVSKSVKFIATVTTTKPDVAHPIMLTKKYIDNEFDYSFLDNHPGIINIDRLQDIPADYEGLMAVPLTVLEYKNIIHFNVHRIIYNPIHNGKCLYPRVVVSNKIALSN